MDISNTVAMSGWDTMNNAPADEGGFRADTGFTTDGGDTNTFNGISKENTSMHATSDEGKPRDGGCRVCGADSHFARDCPDKQTGCFVCGEEGHSKAECPNKPAEKCRLCGDDGHRAVNCSANRLILEFNKLGIKDLTPDEAWKQVVLADQAKDVTDIKEALFTYAKAYPEITFQDIERTLRESGMNTHLIAKAQQITDTMVNVNLQGKTDQVFVVSIQFSAQPRRARMAEDWPKSPEENLERLGNAGITLDRHTQKCSNCDQLGHGSKNCPEERREAEKVAITCANCNEEGHRARDCTQERKFGKAKSRECRNCGGTDHISKDCTEPPNMDNIQCKSCEQTGHFAKDCPQQECRNCRQLGHHSRDCVNERVMVCRNCDEVGHMSKECTRAKDWSRVKCSNCEEMGHTYRRCPQPLKEKNEEEGAGDDAGGDGGW